MNYYKFDLAESEQTDLTSAATSYMTIFVRGVGVVLLLIGLWVAIKVINEAWALYQEPHNIERLAQAIEQGSNLDKALAPITSRPAPRSSSSQDTSGTNPFATDDRDTSLYPVVDETFRLSYFLAWFIVFLIFLLIGRLAMAAIKTGGELALYDTEVRLFARTLLKEAKKTQGKRYNSP